MPALTVKNIPETLYNRLKEAASAHHRSINSELIHCLEQMLLPQQVSPSEHLKRARELRRDIDTNFIDIDDIQEAINEGRS
ncbi:Arc family DNA-binding protein [Sansalvadorimonas verongulae]|nr:Arc family DNA-binding protein [Sansalvadorimonas verongulae]